MNLNPPNFASLDPYAPVRPDEFERIALEKIKIHCREFISPALLEDLRFQRDRVAEQIGQQIAYRIEAAVYGRESWEQTIEKRTETGQTQEKTAEKTVIRDTKGVPLTWWDHLKFTLLEHSRKSRIHTWAKKQDYPSYDEEQKPTIKGRVARWYFDWRCSRQSALKWKMIDIEMHEHHHYKVTPVTKHIEVKKHFHICPHLNIASDRPHIEFLANTSTVR